MELEKQNKQLRENAICEKCGGRQENDDGGIIPKQIGGEGLPKVPEKFTLTGHREKITKLQLHPSFTLLASASSDATIKIWDYDQGDNESTLRSHLGNINYISFHPNGRILASCSAD